MLLNLTDILSNEGKVEDFTITYSPAFYKKAGGQFKVLEDGPISLILSNTGKGKLKLSGEGRLLLQARCDRCLTRVDIPIEISFDEQISEECIQNPTEDADAFSYLDGYSLDTDILIGNEILINWPVKILCKEDCKGVCQFCGANLNEGQCSCKKPVDPRLEALKQLLDN